MSDVAYGQLRGEAVYLTPETPPHTLTHPAPGDRVLLRGPAHLVPALPQWVEVPEAGLDLTHLVRGKIPAGTFDLTTYLTVPRTRGVPPPWHRFAENAFTASVDADGRYHYRPPGDPTATLTLTHVADNLVHWFRGCKVSACTLRVSGSTEGSLVWRGILGPSASAGYMTLDQGVPAGAANDVLVLTVRDRPVCLLGPDPTDGPRLQIDAELLDVLAVDYTLRQLTVVRGRLGTTAAAHVPGSRIAPYVPLGTPGPGTIIPLMLGRCTVDGTPIRVVELTVTQDEHLEARLHDYGTAALTAYGRPITGRSTTVAFTAYQRAAQPRSALTVLTRIAEGVPLPLLVVAGDATIGEVAVALPRFFPAEAETGDLDGDFTLGYEGVGLASESPGGDAFALLVEAPGPRTGTLTTTLGPATLVAAATVTGP